MGRDSDSMRKVFDLSVKEIEEVLSNKKSITDTTRLAASSLLSYGKIKTCDLQEEAMRLGLRGGGKATRAIKG